MPQVLPHQPQVMALGSMTAGLLADALVRWGMPITRVRKAVQSVAFLIPAAALCVLANPATISPVGAVACLTVALGTTSLGAEHRCSEDLETYIHLACSVARIQGHLKWMLPMRM